MTGLRRLLLLSIALGGSIVWLILRAQDSASSSRDQSEAPPSQLQISQGPTETYANFINHVVKPGDTFAGILSLYGVPQEKAIACYRSLVNLGCSKLYPGDSLVFSVTPTGSVNKLSLLSGVRNWYSMTLDGLNISANRQLIPTTSIVMLAKGTIQTSLSEALFQMGIGDAAVTQFADIFAWDINFFMDPRANDTFEIVLEKQFAGTRFIGYGEIKAARYVNAGHEFCAIGLPDTNGHVRYFDQSGHSVQKEFLKAPLRFNRISSRFSYQRKNPITGILQPHFGIDYAAPPGTPVYAAADGLIQFAGWQGGFGNLIRIQHGASYQTYYGHLQAIARRLGSGIRVKQGELIGWVGSTGMSTGPHLDYRMSIGGRLVNPLSISTPSRSDIGEADHARFSMIKHEYFGYLNQRFKIRPGCWILDIIETGMAKSSDTPYGNQGS